MGVYVSKAIFFSGGWHIRAHLQWVFSLQGGIRERNHATQNRQITRAKTRTRTLSRAGNQPFCTFTPHAEEVHAFTRLKIKFHVTTPQNFPNHAERKIPWGAPIKGPMLFSDWTMIASPALFIELSPRKGEFFDTRKTSKILEILPPPPLNVNWRYCVTKSIYKWPLSNYMFLFQLIFL